MSIDANIPELQHESRRRVRIPQQARSRRSREAVLEAAIYCFEAHGYDETTTALIAERAGIAVGTLYSYFRDKREILLELLDSTVAVLASEIIETLDPEHWRGEDPRELVRGLIDAIFHTQKLRPGLQRLMWERYFKDEEFRQRFVAIRDRTREAVDRFADALAFEGRLRACWGMRTRRRDSRCNSGRLASALTILPGWVFLGSRLD